jgi:hypothetical protein
MMIVSSCDFGNTMQALNDTPFVPQDRGTNRRGFLQTGGLGLLGVTGSVFAGPLNVVDAAVKGQPGRIKRCILLFLLGGPSQHSTWDPKPDAAEEIRGAYKPIQTSVPGIQISELLPETSKLMEHIALLRAVTTGDHAHSSSGYAMLTGQPHQPTNREGANPGAPNDWPTFAAVVQFLRRQQPHIMPPAVRLPHHIFNTDQSVWPGQDSGFLGVPADPWLFRCEPTSADFQVPEFQLHRDVPDSRFGERRKLLDHLDRRLFEMDRAGAFKSHTDIAHQALNLLGSKTTVNACNLALEPAASRDRYGSHPFGQSVLLGRRLLEAGVSVVQVNWFRSPDEPPAAPCWDSHADETRRLKEALVPPLDQAYSALLRDLIDRDMLQDTLVVCMGEFGRTPKFNARGGRDHWGHCFSVALAGGGVQGGSVHGSSDKHAAYPVSGVVRPHDVTATMFDLLGHPPNTEIHDRLGRPLPVSRGRVIREILS